MNPTLSLFCAACAWMFTSALGAQVPQAVSPGSNAGIETIVSRCPTFSWDPVVGARGHELVVYAVSAADGVGDSALPSAEADPVIWTRLPGAASSWSPSLDLCLEPARTYAWSVRAVQRKRASDWSLPALFQVSATPSPGQVEEALEVLRSYLERQEERSARGPLQQSAPTSADAVDEGRALARAPRTEPWLGRPLGSGRASGSFPARPFPAVALTERTAEAAAPTLGTASLSVDGQIHLGAASSFFKESDLFLWTDFDDANVALGQRALSSVNTGVDNTAVGSFALVATTGDDPATVSRVEGSSNTAVGSLALALNTNGLDNTAVGVAALFANQGDNPTTSTPVEGSSNTAVGVQALGNNTTGWGNTALGAFALSGNEVGFGNVGVGDGAVSNNTEGIYNVGLGAGALSGLKGSHNVGIGFNAGIELSATDTPENNNILINSWGEADDQNTLRIGRGDGTEFQQLQQVFIHGIRTAIVDQGDPVCISTDSQLGLCTVSSLRFKEGVRHLEGTSERLFELRPVSFRYRREVNGSAHPVQYGLIAEEVAEVFPELVTFDEEGRPFSVRYHALIPLLLKELQEQRRQIETLMAESICNHSRSP